MTTKKPVRPGAGATRVIRVKMKKKRGMKELSRRWLERHMNDPYVQRSKAEGYRSRAAYKLIEIDDRHHLLKPGQRVIDLGAAPGGWLQVAAARTGSTDADPHIVGIDYLEMDPVPGSAFLQMDFLDDAAPARLAEMLGGDPDIVLSDMAAPTTGHRRTDHIRTDASVRGGGRLRHDRAPAGRPFPGQDVPGRNRGRTADPTEEEFSFGASRQAAGVARRIGRTLPAGQGIQGQGATG